MMFMQRVYSIECLPCLNARQQQTDKSKMRNENMFIVQNFISSHYDMIKQASNNDKSKSHFCSVSCAAHIIHT